MIFRERLDRWIGRGRWEVRRILIWKPSLVRWWRALALIWIVK